MNRCFRQSPPLCWVALSLVFFLLLPLSACDLDCNGQKVDKLVCAGSTCSKVPCNAGDECEDDPCCESEGSECKWCKKRCNIHNGNYVWQSDSSCGCNTCLDGEPSASCGASNLHTVTKYSCPVAGDPCEGLDETLCRGTSGCHWVLDPATFVGECEGEPVIS